MPPRRAPAPQEASRRWIATSSAKLPAWVAKPLTKADTPTNLRAKKPGQPGESDIRRVHAFSEHGNWRAEVPAKLTARFARRSAKAALRPGELQVMPQGHAARLAGAWAKRYHAPIPERLPLVPSSRRAISSLSSACALSFRKSRPMQINSSTFLAWQTADELARGAEIRLFYSACWTAGNDLTAEVVRARQLRAEAGIRLRLALDEIRMAADSVEPRTPGQTPWRSHGVRGGT